MERALTLFLGNGYSCLCSAGVMIVLIRKKKKKLFKQPALAAGIKYHEADPTSPGQQISIQTPALIKNRKIMELEKYSSM